MPEQREAHHPAQHVGTKTLCEDLGHHGEEPQYAGRDVEAVAADQREERGQESAARRAIAAGNEISELAKLNDEKDEAEQTRHRHPEIEPEPVAHIGCDARHAARETRQQQADSLDRDVPLLEYLRTLRAAGGLVGQHRIGRKEAREHHDVGEQEDPEAIGGHDALRRGSGMLDDEPDVMGIGMCPASGCGHRHQTAPAMLTRLRRSSRLMRSMRATSSAGMTYSSWSRQANTTKVANAPMPPRITIHQMCQMSAKPMMVAKNAQTKPVGEFRGISMSRYSCGSCSSDCCLA